MLRKLKLFLFMPGKRLFLEAFLFLGWGRLLKFFPFSKVANGLGKRMRETSFEEEYEHRLILYRISYMISLAKKYTFWESECLVKAYAAIKMLERRGIAYTLYLGTGKDENGKLVAHAWIRSGPFYITGYEGMEDYTVVATFANDSFS